MASPNDQSEHSNIPRVTRHSGIIAVFDVLGFKSFCEHNSNQAVANGVLDAIVSLPTAVTELVSSGLSGGNPREKDASARLMDKVQWQILSDTIVASLQVDEDTQSTSFVVFLMTCAVLNRTMFEQGLPVRGAIHWGETYWGNGCVAGKALVHAIEQANTLEAACTVLSFELFSILQQRFSDQSPISSIMLGMIAMECVPCKRGPQNLPTLRWPYVRIGKEAESWKFSLKNVLEKFLAHSKQINSQGLIKAQNTADLLTKWSSQDSKPRS